MKLSIIIPIKDEPYVQKLINKIHKVLLKTSHEIIVVDKSTRIKKIKNAKHVIQKSNGLGNAILEGSGYSTGDFIITMDGDGSHTPGDLLKFVEKMNRYDIIVGSRYIKGSRVSENLFRIIISRVYCLIGSLLLNLTIKDNMSGFVASKREVYEKLEINPFGFKINTEILFKAKKFNFKCVEIPIKFLKRKSGKQKNGVIEAIKILFHLIGLRLGLR